MLDRLSTLKEDCINAEVINDFELWARSRSNHIFPIDYTIDSLGGWEQIFLIKTLWYLMDLRYYIFLGDSKDLQSEIYDLSNSFGRILTFYL